MNRNRLAIALLAVVAVVGVALAASGFDTPEPGSDGEGEGGTGRAVNPVEGPQPVMEGFQDEFVLRLLYVAIVVAVLAGLVVGALTGFVSNRSILLAALFILVVAGGLLAEFEGDPPSPFENTTNESRNATSIDTQDPNATPTPGNATESAGDRTTPPTGLLALFVGFLLLGLLVVGQFTRGRPEPSEPAPVEEDAQDEVGRIAGRAADRIEDGELPNVIYRAWRDMTEALDVSDPETTTPAAFAEAAIDAGVAEADARSLTELFREVRYGDAPATADREERARETLRRIEDAYASDEEGAGT